MAIRTVKNETGTTVSRRFRRKSAASIGRHGKQQHAGEPEHARRNRSGSHDRDERVPGEPVSEGAAGWSVPRTPDGHPDMQGVWANNGMTPLERPKQFGLRATMTDAELDDLKKGPRRCWTAATRSSPTSCSSRPRGQGEVQVHRHADRQLRPDVAVRPRVRQPHVAHHRSARRPHSAARPPARPSGRGPQAAARAGRGPADQRAGSVAWHPLRQLRHAQHPGRLSELLRHHAGPRRRGAAQRDDPRRAHLPDRRRPHVSKAITQYHGDSRAHWEGDTLVVDTANFSTNATRFGGHGEAARRRRNSAASPPTRSSTT